ncbi:MAG TPA: CGNR zinc finger domain-containing protein [Steroidobacteraceae bacterium]|jgi:predicted RNA-binding Zn ribbon-like protein|nr:CGNR zinc finger domain-containing protein [Steroidobacteraceae bacterium]
MNLLNSIRQVGSRRIDRLETGEGLLAWLEELHLIPVETSQGLRARFSSEDLGAAAAEARGLREWFRAFVHEHKGRPLVEAHLRKLTRLNRLLERDGTYSQIVLANENATQLEIVIQHRWQSPESLVITLARALAAFICEEDFSGVKMCARAGCTLFFVDRTAGHIRKWCQCGDRAMH